MGGGGGGGADGFPDESCSRFADAGLKAHGTDPHGILEGSREEIVGVMHHTPEAVMSIPLQLRAPGGKRGVLVWARPLMRGASALVSVPAPGAPSRTPCGGPGRGARQEPSVVAALLASHNSFPRAPTHHAEGGAKQVLHSQPRGKQADAGVHTQEERAGRDNGDLLENMPICYPMGTHKPWSGPAAREERKIGVGRVHILIPTSLRAQLRGTTSAGMMVPKTNRD